MNKVLPSQLGQHIRSLRQEVGLTRNQFAEQVKLSPTQLLQIEEGDITLDLEIIRRIIVVLEVTEKELLTGISKSEISIIERKYKIRVFGQDDKYVLITQEGIRVCIQDEKEVFIRLPKQQLERLGRWCLQCVES